MLRGTHHDLDLCWLCRRPLDTPFACTEFEPDPDGGGGFVALAPPAPAGFDRLFSPETHA